MHFGEKMQRSEWTHTPGRKLGLGLLLTGLGDWLAEAGLGVGLLLT